MDLLNTTVSQTLLPGQRLLKVNGYENAEKYPIPRDCEAVLFDEVEPYIYIKKTDTNGGTTFVRCRYEEEPIPHFNPAEYVTVTDFNKFKEDILNGFNDLREAVSGAANNAKSNGSTGGKQFGKSNNAVSQPTANV